jgi:hypothetical protein
MLQIAHFSYMATVKLCMMSPNNDSPKDRKSMKYTNHQLLAVGINNYKNNNPLVACHADANELARVLSRKGFNETVLLSVSMQDVRSQLMQLAAKACNQDDTIVFYFSGHGMDLTGEQILLGPDFQGDVANTYEDRLRLAEILEILCRSPANKVVIVDACRNTGAAKLEKEVLNELEESWHATIKTSPKVTIVYSTGVGQIAQGATSDMNLSRFTHYLIKNLTDYNTTFAHAFFSTAKNLEEHPHSPHQAPWFFTSAANDVLADASPISVTQKFNKGIFRSRDFSTCADGVLLLDDRYGISKDTPDSRSRITYTSAKMASRISVSEKAGTVAILERTRALLIKDVFNTLDASGTPKAPFFNIRSVKLHQEITGLAFAELSPLGDYVATGSLFFHCASNQNFRTKAATLNVWDISKSKKRKIELKSIPQWDANAALWIDDKNCFVTFSSPASLSTEIWHLDLGSPGSPSLQKKFECDGIVTALTRHLADTLVLGFSTGAVEVRGFNGALNASFVRQQKLNESYIYSQKNWSNKDGRESASKNSLAVASMTFLAKKNTLAVGYFDQWIGFYDLELSGHIADFPPPADEGHALIRIHANAQGDGFLVNIGRTSYDYQVGFP